MLPTAGPWDNIIRDLIPFAMTDYQPEEDLEVLSRAVDTTAESIGEHRRLGNE